MEIRRIEGILLQHAVEQAQSSRAQRTGEDLRIKVLSAVPNVLLEISSSGGSAIRAEVSSSEGNFINLTVKGGFELRAENKSSLTLIPGDLLELTLESENPPTFKITGLYRKGYTEDLLSLFLKAEEKFQIPINPERLKENVENSGLFYERKLLELLFGKLKPEHLMKDIKAQLIQPLLAHARELSTLLNMEYEQNTEGIRKLLETLKQKIETFNFISSSLKGLLLQDLDHQQYASFIRMLEAMGGRPIIRALEDKNIPALLQDLWNLAERGVLKEYKEVFERLMTSQERAVRDFFRLVADPSRGDIKEAYRVFLEYMDRGTGLLEFYNSKGQHMESLLNRLDFINNLQWLAAQQGDAFYFPAYYEGGRGGLLFKAGRDYSVVFRFEYGDGFVAGLLRMPRTGGHLDVMFFTDIQKLAEKIKVGKDMLEKMLAEEKIKLRNFSVSVSTREQVADTVRSLYGEGFLLLA